MERSRSFWIDGRATFTIVASRTTMNCAKHTTTSTSHGLTGVRRRRKEGTRVPFRVTEYDETDYAIHFSTKRSG